MDMIKKLFYSFLILVFLTGIGTPLCPQQAKKQSDVQERGIEVVFIVDVSPSLMSHMNPILDFIGAVIDSLKNIRDKKYHLITFCEKPKFFEHESQQINKESILEEIKNEIDKKNKKGVKKTFPLYALINSFELIEKHFPQKVGIVIFVSDGEDSRNEKSKQAQNDLQQVIIALNKVGFTIFNVFVDTGKSDFVCEPCMESIAEWSGTSLIKITNKSNLKKIIDRLKNKILDTEFKSPVSREVFKIREKSWEEEIKAQVEQKSEAIDSKRKAEEKVEELTQNLEKADKKVKDLSKELKNSHKKITKQRDFNTLIYVILILTLILIIGYFNWKFFPLNKHRLWGKFVLKDKNGKETVFDLSKRLNPWNSIIKTPDDYPNITLIPKNHNGKRVLWLFNKRELIFCLNKEREQCNNNNYIDQCVSEVKVLNYSKENPIYLKYHFLDILEASYSQPAWSPEYFKGRIEIINKIVKEFSEEKKKFHHFRIAGMGCSGKTSLLKHLMQVKFEEEQLKKKYLTVWINFDKDKHSNYDAFEKDFRNEVQGKSNYKRKKVIIFIDEYDVICGAFKRSRKKFLELISKYRKSGYFFIIAGRRLMRDRFSSDLPSTETYEAILHNIGQNSSMELIDSLLVEIGFRKEYLRDEAKQAILEYSSGMPYFIKRILYELFKEWLEKYDRHLFGVNSFNRDDIQKAVGHVINSDAKLIRDAPIFRIRRNDQDKSFSKLPHFMINKLSEKKGTVDKEKFVNEMMIKYEVVEGDKQKIIEQKLNRLIQLGFIVKKENTNTLSGVPYMFYYKGEKLIDV